MTNETKNGAREPWGPRLPAQRAARRAVGEQVQEPWGKEPGVNHLSATRLRVLFFGIRYKCYTEQHVTTFLHIVLLRFEAQVLELLSSHGLEQW